MSSFMNLAYTYPPYSYKCHFLLPSSLLLCPPLIGHSLNPLLQQNPPSFPPSSHQFHLQPLSSQSLSPLSFHYSPTSTTMIKTLNPYPNPAKTAEIMSRYRPIAPKPDPDNNSTVTEASQKINNSPYLRHLWPQLQARPTRARKRGRSSSGPISLPPPSLKKHKNHILGFSPQIKILSSQAFNFNHGIGVLNCQLEKANAGLVTLPLLPCSPSPPPNPPAPPKFDLEDSIDLKLSTNNVPEEKDLLQQLLTKNSNAIIAPQPIRPIGSCISVGCISEDPMLVTSASRLAPRKPEEVEEEVESEALPAVISDSKHKIRVANSAYKEMVGQPECPWLESMVSGGGGKRKRIGGEVTLRLCESGSRIPVWSNGFSCWVRIEWQSGEDGRKKSCVNAFCDVVKCACESRDYLFTWRFHTRTREASQSSCNV